MEALQIYKTALLSPEVREIFISKAVPNTEQINRFQKALDGIESGAIYTALGKEYCTKHNINADDIWLHGRLPELVVKAMQLYAKLSSSRVGVGDFAMNNTWITSPLLVYMSKVASDTKYCEFIDSIKVDVKLSKEFYNRYKKKLINPLASIIMWYRENIGRLNSTSYGTINNSPLRSEKEFIKELALYMIVHGPIYHNSPAWHIYKELLTNMFHINWEGDVVVIKKPRYRHTKAELAGVTNGGYKIVC